jgi:hypothetical protein
MVHAQLHFPQGYQQNTHQIKAAGAVATNL